MAAVARLQASGMDVAADLQVCLQPSCNQFPRPPAPVHIGVLQMCVCCRAFEHSSGQPCWFVGLHQDGPYLQSAPAAALHAHDDLLWRALQQLECASHTQKSPSSSPPAAGVVPNEEGGGGHAQPQHANAGAAQPPGTGSPPAAAPRQRPRQRIPRRRPHHPGQRRSPLKIVLCIIDSCRALVAHYRYLAGSMQ